jgi:hypothetical protein
MRYSGGLLGGSWLTALASDLGAGKFDGAHLVANFENLNPANTLWTKHYKVWANVDSEAHRFLESEKWWGGHVNLNAEEIQWIVDRLFVGNRLATAEIVTRDGVRIDLRNINSPIVCFCSKGDNITPPPQALGWICDLYQKDEDILAQGQTIVYAIHETAGHLGIFVSGDVARKEYGEFASNIDLIDVLPPGLWEAVMTRKTTDAIHPELVSGDWIVRFERRTLNHIRAIVRPDRENEQRFATVRRVSEINLGLYRTLLQPFVRASASEQTAEWLHTVHPSELPFELFSDRNALMREIPRLAEQVRQQRRPASPDQGADCRRRPAGGGDPQRSLHRYGGPGRGRARLQPATPDAHRARRPDAGGVQANAARAVLRADPRPGGRRGRDSKHAIGRQSPKRRAGGDPRRRIGGRRSHR